MSGTSMSAGSLSSPRARRGLSSLLPKLRRSRSRVAAPAAPPPPPEFPQPPSPAAAPALEPAGPPPPPPPSTEVSTAEVPASEPSEVTAAEEEHEAEAPGSDGAAASRPQPVRKPIDAPRWLRDACFDLGRAITVDWHARGAGDAACAALADACDGGRGLAQCVRIDLSANGVTDAGLGELIAAGREGGLRHVVRLDLSHNRLTDAGVCSLADALADGCFRNLCDLRLGGNGFGDPALEQLALALYSPTLQAPIRELNIWRHRGTTAGRQALEAAAAALEAPAQVKPPIAFYLTVAFPSGDKSIGVPASPLDVLEELLSSCLRCAQCRGPDDATRDAIDEVHAKFLQWQERWTFTIDLTPQHTAAAGSQARMSQPGSVKRVK